jgi:hypothetical protein
MLARMDCLRRIPIAGRGMRILGLGLLARGFLAPSTLRLGATNKFYVV